MSKESKTKTGRRSEMLLKERDLVRAENERLTAELAAARAEMRKLIDACKQHIRGDHNAEWGCDMVFSQAVAAAEKARETC